MHAGYVSSYFMFELCRASGNSSTFLSLQVSAITALLLQIKKNWKNISHIDCLQHYKHWPERMGQKMSPLPRATDWLNLRLV